MTLIHLRRSLLSTLLVVSFTVLAHGFQALGISDASIVLTLLMAVVLCGWFFGTLYSIFAAILSILSHSYFFSYPIYSFQVNDPQHYVAFAFMLVIGVIISALAQRIKTQKKSLQFRKQGLEILNQLGRKLSNQIDREGVEQIAEELLSEVLQCKVQVVTKEENGDWSSEDDPELLRLRVVAEQTRNKVGWTTAIEPDAALLVCPLVGSNDVVGVLVVSRAQDLSSAIHEKLLLLETLSSTVSLSLERVLLIEESRNTAVLMETEKARNTLLHGVSHDLRTPLTVISANVAGMLLERANRADDPDRTSLESIKSETDALIGQINNLLELTRLSAGSLTLRREWVPVEDIISSCTEVFYARHPGSTMTVHYPADIKLCYVDEELMQHALMNLLGNAAQYGGTEAPIEIEALSHTNYSEFIVRDRGPGIPDAEKKLIFGKFERGSSSKKIPGHRGSGLGLSIIEAIVNLHKGNVGVRDRQGGGAEFWIRLPVPESRPQFLEQSQ